VKESPSDLLDWTVTHAPDLDEPTPPPASSRPPGHKAALSARTARRMMWITGLVIAGAALGAGMLTLWNGYQAWREIRSVVLAEEQAAFARNPDRLLRLQEAGDSGWRSAQFRLAQRGLAAPLPLGLLRPVAGMHESLSVTPIAPNAVRADVRRKYRAPDGAVYTFALPQFYRRVNNAWKHMAPPDSYWGESRVFSGRYVEVRYLQVDAAFAQELGPTLDQALAQACLAWREACPPDFQFTLYLNLTLPTAPPSAADLEQETPDAGLLLFNLLPSDRLQFWSTDLHLPSPHAAGYPADNASAALLKRAIALQVLAQTAQHLTFADGGIDRSQNAFLHALVARKAAGLGLEDLSVVKNLPPTESLGLDILWDMNYAYPPEKYRAEALREALSLLNKLLPGDPDDVERRLFQSLRTARGPLEWLAEGVGIPKSDLPAKLLALAGDAGEVAVLPIPPHEFALGCEGGPAAFSRGDPRLSYLLSARFPDAYLTTWSPDGRWLGVYVGGQSVVIDLKTRTLHWLPRPIESSEPYVRGWISDTLAAYILWPRFSPSSSNWDPSNITLNFYDFAARRSEFAPIAGIQDYALSPDRSQAAVVWQDRGGFREEISLISARGGTPNASYYGREPAWSPDGKRLAYMQSSGATFSLYVAEPAAEAKQEILRGTALGPDVGYAQFAWSPAGDLIAFVAAQYETTETSRVWLGTISPDGARLRVLQSEKSYRFGPAFSADGRFLAWTASEGGWEQPDAPMWTVVYEADTGREVSSLPQGKQSSFAWSPTGHALVVTNDDGVYWLAEPGDPEAKLEKLVEGKCSSVMWNPAGGK